MINNWDDYYAARVENIKSQVTVADVLQHYGIDVRTVEREFQYPCPLHGDGQDNSYSARLYPDNFNGSGGTFCFACQKSRDVVGWVKDKEGLPFSKALKHIERTFHVQNVPKAYIDPEDVEARSIPRKSIARDVDPKPELLKALEAVEAQLRRQVKTNREHFGMDKILRMFFVLDTVRFQLEEDTVDLEASKAAVGKIYQALQKAPKR